MSKSLKELLAQYVNGIQEIYGDTLEAIILYGSYARGDFNDNSDIDIMILVKMDDYQIKEKQNALSDLTFNYNFDNGIEIMPIVKNLEHFNKWLNAYPFYNNVRKEGLELYAS